MAHANANNGELVDPTQRRYRGCAKISDFEITAKLGEGTFGVVSKGRSKRTGAVVALKKILMHNERDGFPITALREIKLLKMLSHPNVLKLDEMAIERVQGQGKKRATMYMITPYMDHDLTGMTTNPDIHFTVPQIKCYMLQLLDGLSYLHASNILHRDMKAANLLISNKGNLQIADFGLARHYDGPSPRPGHGNGDATRDYTTLVVTRWYRPPELLLQLRRYTPAIDMWGAGCVFAEMFECKPILEGKTDLNQAEIIFDLLGSPTEETMPGWLQLPGCEGVKDWGRRKANITSRFKILGPEGLDLLQDLLKLDWRTRINAQDAMKHKYFTTHPLPSRPQDLPRFEESHELDRRKHQEKRSNRPPPAPAGGAVGMGPDDSWAPHRERGNGPPMRAGFDDRDRDRGRYPPGPPRDRGPPGSTLLPPGTNSLPPRPPPTAGPPARVSVDRDDPYARRPPPTRIDSRAPPTNGGPGRPNGADSRIDTYVPNYNGTENRPPPRERRNDDQDRPGPPRRDDRDLFLRDRDGPPRSRDEPPRNKDGPARDGDEPPNRGTDRDMRDRDRNRDRDSGRDTYRGEAYRDQDRDRDRDFTRRRRSRSRSPGPVRATGGNNDAFRDRDRDRDRIDRDRDRDRRDRVPDRGPDRDRNPYRR